jgi:hypothetical protein
LFAPFEENLIWQLQMATWRAKTTIRLFKAMLKIRSLPVPGLTLSLTLGLIGRLEQSTWAWEEPKVHIEQFISMATGTVNIEFWVPVEERYEQAWR